MINIKNKSIKTRINEFSLKEYELISNKLAENTNNYIDKYLSILEILDVEEEFINSLTDTEFMKFVKEFNKEDNTYKKNKIKSFVLNNKTYIAWSDKEFSLNAKDLSAISKIIANNIDIFPGIIAVIFKECGLDFKKHYEQEHINEKINLFKNLKASEFIVYIQHIINKIQKELNKI